MTIWNLLIEFYSTIKKNINNFYYHIKDYYYGHHDTWLFIPGHTIPLSLSNLNNMINITWIYDNYNNTLSITREPMLKFINYKFSWLSAKIVIYKKDSKKEEYEIDNFIENFSLNTVNEIMPSLYMIFMCWCAHTKHWFSPDDNIEFHIIDNMGEDTILNLNNENLLCIQKNKIHIVLNKDDNININNDYIDIIQKEVQNIILEEINTNKDE
jgi:hypothetical protein